MRGPGVEYVPETREQRELRYSAEMTQNQFQAILSKCETATIINQLQTLPYMQQLRRSRIADIAEIGKWLKNGWNTENLIRFTHQSFNEDSLIFAIQWAFPQLYYSVFSTLLAYFETVGHTEKSHTSVLRKFGSLAETGRYPETISYLANGGIRNIHFHGVTESPGYQAIQFDVRKNDLIENQICHFLRSTRRIDLARKKEKFRIPKKSGKGNKKIFNDEDWEKVSDSLGYTSLLSLLYRKRIKSNYRDIDTFLSEHLNADSLFEAFIQIANGLNMIHETFIAKSIGLDSYNKIVSDLDYEFLKERAGVVSSLVE